MFKFKFKFRDQQEQEVTAAAIYEVRWCSRWGSYSGNITPEIRVFTTKKDAEDFKKALEDAFKLIKHTSGNRVTLTYNDSH
jgi:hypothetical protein